MSDIDPATPTLAPVADALIATATARAEQLRAQAAAEANALLAQARERADEITAQARRQGAADAAAMRAVMRVRARRQARAAVLQAREQVYQQLRARARVAVADLRNDPGYGRLRDHLGQAVRRALGDDADIRDAESGGVIGLSAGRRMDCSLAAFADRAVQELAGELFSDQALPAPREVAR